jgi:hypothetical protein
MGAIPPTIGMRLELIIDAGLGPLKDHPFGTLNLHVGFRVVHHLPVHLDVLRVTKVKKLSSSKLGTIISDNVVRNPEPTDDILDELCCYLKLEVGDGSDLNPLGEFVNGCQELIKPPRALRNLPYHANALDYKWPCD